jgi:hypothetical protein
VKFWTEFGFMYLYFSCEPFCEFCEIIHKWKMSEGNCYYWSFGYILIVILPTLVARLVARRYMKLLYLCFIWECSVSSMISRYNEQDPPHETRWYEWGEIMNLTRNGGIFYSRAGNDCFGETDGNDIRRN